MHRHLYTVLLFVSTILAVTVCLRPNLGVELMARAETWLEEGARAAQPPAVPGAYPVAGEAPPRPSQGGRPASWPIRPADPDEIIAGEYEPYRPPGEPPSTGLGPVTAPNWWRDRPPLAPTDPNRFPGPGPRVGRLERPSPDAAPPPAGLPPRTDLAPVTVVPSQEAPTVRESPWGADDPAAEAISCEGAQIVARVASHAVLMSDVWVAAEHFLAVMHQRGKDKHPEGAARPTPAVIARERDALVQAQFRALVNQLVETKLAYYEAIDAIPPEGLKNIEEQVHKFFEKSQIPMLAEFYGAQSSRELDQWLAATGTSLHRHRRAFLERTLSAQWVVQKIKVNDEVGHEEMLAWYQEHLADFERPARARWEQLTVRVANYPSRQAARAALAQAGNQVLDGRPMGDAAGDLSGGAGAPDGTARDWTTQGSLRSEVLDRAIFGLPVGHLSPILEDGDSLHIVRVLEREGGERTPFVEAQVKIREEIRKQRGRIQQQAYVDRLRERVPVWTVFDGRPPSRGAPGAGM